LLPAPLGYPQKIFEKKEKKRKEKKRKEKSIIK
jgi:hypothetical protein